MEHVVLLVVMEHVVLLVVMEHAVNKLYNNNNKEKRKEKRKEKKNLTTAIHTQFYSHMSPGFLL
jgi:hypothetical protein